MAFKERPCEVRLALILFACLHLAGACIAAGTEAKGIFGKELDIEVSSQLGFESADKPSSLSDASHSSTPVESSKSRDQLSELFLKSDRALQFDGKDDYVHIPSFQGLPRRHITVAAWVKIRQHRNWNRIVSHNWINNGWNLFTDGTGVAHFGIGQRNKDYAAAKITHRDRWHYLVGTYDGEAVRVYVDGVEGVNAPLRGAELDERGSVFVGGGDWDPFNGVISEVRIWSRAQSAHEVRRNMFQRPNSDDQTLVGFYDFDESEGSTVFDRSWFKNHGVLGADHRAPARFVSDAPVSTPCIGQSEASTRLMAQLHELGAERISSITVVRRGGIGNVYVGTRRPEMEKKISVKKSQSDVTSGGGQLEMGDRSWERSNVGAVGKQDETQQGENEGPRQAVCAANENFTEDARLCKDGTRVPKSDVGNDDGETRGLEFSEISDPFCLEVAFESREGDGDVSEPSGRLKVVHVDVCGTAEQCRVRPLHPDSCWGVRTELHFIRPISPPLPNDPSDGHHVAAGRAPSLPRVSVILPVYNAGKDLPEAVESVVAQTFEDWEIIVVNDGSTDDSADVISGLERRFAHSHRLRVVNKANGGLADARNAGIHVAAGEWILPLDADDMIEPTFLNKAFKVIDANRTVNLVIADFRGFGDWEYTWGIPPFSAEDLPYTNMFHCSGMFRKELWEAAGGYPTTTLLGYEDWAFWIAANQATPLHPHRIDEELFLARMRRGSMHRKLMWFQSFSVASMRILFPGLYTVEMLLDAHLVFFNAPAHIVSAVEKKVAQFPHLPHPRLMRGLIKEGQLLKGAVNGTQAVRSALEDYTAAVELTGKEDWQPKWRLGLFQRRLGAQDEGLRVIDSLESGFTEVDASLRHSRLKH